VARLDLSLTRRRCLHSRCKKIKVRPKPATRNPQPKPYTLSPKP